MLTISVLVRISVLWVRMRLELAQSLIAIVCLRGLFVSVINITVHNLQQNIVAAIILNYASKICLRIGTDLCLNQNTNILHLIGKIMQNLILQALLGLIQPLTVYKVRQFYNQQIKLEYTASSQVKSHSMSQSIMPQSEISINQIPKFQFELRNEELVNCIKQLSFNMKNQEKTMQKLKKDIQNRTTQSQLTQAMVFVNSFIQIDPNLSKQLKSKQAQRSDLANNPVNASSSDLGKKINQISQSVSILYNSIKSVQKKLSQVEYQSKSSLNQKTTALQEQIDESNSKNNHEFMELKQKIQLHNASFGDKVREVETKTLWQINDCKSRLNTCINEQFVRDAIREMEGKINTKMKEELIRQGSIDPQRINKIQQNISKNEKQFASQLTETNFKIQSLKDNIEKSLMTKKQYGDEKIQLEKRFGLLNTNLADSIRRIRSSESDITEVKDRIKALQAFSQSFTKEVNRMNSVLNNLKIGDDFQKMLEKMDPHKICEIDTRVNDLELNQEKINKVVDIARKQIDRLRSKTQFCNILTPNTGGPATKFNKEEIEAIVHEYFTANLFAKKLQNLQTQITQVKAFPEMVNNINKSLARMQKETDTHNLTYELRGLQEYVKKEILIVNNRINGLQTLINQDKKKRPQSAGKMPFSDTKLGSSVSYKKLTPVNCISCYPSPGGSSTDRKNIIRKL